MASEQNMNPSVPDKFVIYAFGYDPDVGGIIALHRLCDLLNQLGHHARLWPAKQPVRQGNNPVGWFFRALSFKAKLKRKGFALNPEFNTPLATQDDLENAVVIYPEIIDGNPLNAVKVVRWLLHKPGHHTGKHQYGKNDLFFYFNKAFDDPSINPWPDNQLQVTYLLTGIYRQHIFNQRHGGCFLVRKGKNRSLDAHEPDYIKIDGLSHQDTATIFNQCEVFISYDTHTLFSTYAALCGCRSIVIPEPGVSKESWQPDETERYGIAYGMEDLDWAASTLPLLKQRIADLEKASIDSVNNFLYKTSAYFRHAQTITSNPNIGTPSDDDSNHLV